MSVTARALRIEKAGVVAAGTFAGNPKTATVTFTTAFPDATYSVRLAAVEQNGTIYTPNVETKLAGSFIIQMGVNNITDLIEVCWEASEAGEFRT